MPLSATQLSAVFLLTAAAALRAEVPAGLVPFLEDRCAQCHDAETKKGGLDLDALAFDLKDAKSFSAWVKVHDRLAEHEMPPKKKPQRKEEEADAFLKNLVGPYQVTARRWGCQ